MLQTKLSTKGQVIIPRVIRDQMRLTTGMRFEVSMKRDLIVLRPIDYTNPIDQLYGLFAGKGDPITELEREHAREIQTDLKR